MRLIRDNSTNSLSYDDLQPVNIDILEENITHYNEEYSEVCLEQGSFFKDKH